MRDGAWKYWRPTEDAAVEMCVVSGRDVGLPAHFHDEHQVTVVLSGRRRFVVGDRVIDVSEGSAAWIPARIPHRSLDEPAGVECVNVYVPAGGPEPAPWPPTAMRHHARVAVAAAQAGMSREGYSRAFAARYGMPPAAHRRAAQLNAARRLLRSGEPIAAAAAQSGFADQSHLGRWFRRAFGVTPGRYRRGARSSQAF